MTQLEYQLLSQINKSKSINTIALLNSFGNKVNDANYILKSYIADNLVTKVRPADSLHDGNVTLTSQGKSALYNERHRRRTETLQWISIGVTFVVAVLGLFFD